MVSVMSYFIIFYYLVQTVVILQSACLIKAIVQRRIGAMRRRDQEQDQNENELSPEQYQQALNGEGEEEDGGLFTEGMFGGLLSIPLPIPEILS